MKKLILCAAIVLVASVANAEWAKMADGSLVWIPRQSAYQRHVELSQKYGLDDARNRQAQLRQQMMRDEQRRIEREDLSSRLLRSVERRPYRRLERDW